MDNSILIESCLHNDSNARRYFYDSYSPGIMGICMRYAASDSDAGAMALFVFKKLYDELGNYKGNTGLQLWVNERTIWNAVAYLRQDKQKYFIAKTTRYYENNGTQVKILNHNTLPVQEPGKCYLEALRALTPSYRILYNLTYIDKIIPGRIIENLEIAKETYNAELEQARFQFRQHENSVPQQFSADCPASVWEGICVYFNEKKIKADNKWINKVSISSGTPLIAAASIALIVAISWFFFTHSIRKPAVLSRQLPITENTIIADYSQLTINNELPTLKNIAQSLTGNNVNPDVKNNSPEIAQHDKMPKHIILKSNKHSQTQVAIDLIPSAQISTIKETSPGGE